jgi:hypothetical protein
MNQHENDRFRRAFGIGRGELETLIAFCYAKERTGQPTTVGFIGALVEQTYGYHPATTNAYTVRLCRLGLLERLGRCAGSVLYRCTPRGVQRVREWRGDFERKGAAAE